MKKTLAQLKTELKNNLQEAEKINAEIKKMEHKIEIPKLRKKYENRFWKKPHIALRFWKPGWKYSYCRKIDEKGNGIFDWFEIVEYKSGAFMVTVKSNVYVEGYDFLLCEIEITKEEYMKALRKIQLQIVTFTKK